MSLSGFVKKISVGKWLSTNCYLLCEANHKRGSWHLFMNYDKNIEHDEKIKEFNEKKECTVANFRNIIKYRSAMMIKSWNEKRGDEPLHDCHMLPEGGVSRIPTDENLMVG